MLGDFISSSNCFPGSLVGDLKCQKPLLTKFETFSGIWANAGVDAVTF